MTGEGPRQAFCLLRHVAYIHYGTVVYMSCLPGQGRGSQVADVAMKLHAIMTTDDDR